MDEQQATTTPKKSNTVKFAVIGVVVVLLIIVSVIGFQAMGGKKENTSAMQQEVPNENDVTTDSNTSTSPYRDGTYTQIGEYVSPGGPETIEVTVTLTDGAITAVNVTPQAVRPTSKEKQADFAANYKSFVEGKNIDEVELTKVSGSSLTPKGFNDAIEKIKTAARG